MLAVSPTHISFGYLLSSATIIFSAIRLSLLGTIDNISLKQGTFNFNCRFHSNLRLFAA